MLGDKGATLLCAALRSATALEVLGLTSNGIGQDGGLALARLVHVASALRELAVGGNPLFTKPLVAPPAIAEAMGTARALQSITWPCPTADSAGSELGSRARCQWGLALARRLHKQTKTVCRARDPDDSP